MLIQESRTYQLAKAALLAVLLAVTPVTAVLRAQTKPLPTAEKQEDPLNVLYKAADKAFEEKISTSSRNSRTRPATSPTA
jgi:hypothetical protein